MAASAVASSSQRAIKQSVDAMEFLDIGLHCKESTCNRLDFLPFKCSCCGLSFCSEHFRVEQHKCSGDTSKLDNRIPTCPLCKASVNIPAGSNPDERMNAHLENLCPVLLPSGLAKPKMKPGNCCAARRCPTKLIVKMHCDKCNKDFCAAHRFPEDHKCETLKAPLTASKTALTVHQARTRTGLAAIARVRQAAVRAAAKSSTTKQRIAIEIPSDTESDSSIEVVSHSKPNLLQALKPGSSQNSYKPVSTVNKGDSRSQGSNKIEEPKKMSRTDNKHAKAERQSALRSLENRANKGLLTAKEKLDYATLKAAESKSFGKKKPDSCKTS